MPPPAAAMPWRVRQIANIACARYDTIARARADRRCACLKGVHDDEHEVNARMRRREMARRMMEVRRHAGVVACYICVLRILWRASVYGTTALMIIDDYDTRVMLPRVRYAGIAAPRAGDMLLYVEHRSQRGTVSAAVPQYRR